MTVAQWKNQYSIRREKFELSFDIAWLSYGDSPRPLIFLPNNLWRANFSNNCNCSKPDYWSVSLTNKYRGFYPSTQRAQLAPSKNRGKAWFYKIFVTLVVTGTSAKRAMSRVKIIKCRGGSIGHLPILQTQNNLVIMIIYIQACLSQKITSFYSVVPAVIMLSRSAEPTGIVITIA